MHDKCGQKILILITLVSLGFPTGSFALEASSAEVDSGGTQQKEAREERFCQKLGERYQRALKKVESLKNRRQENRKETFQRQLEEKEEYLRDRLGKKREMWNEKMEFRLKRLKELAKTEAQEQAVQEFQETLLEAITIRREAKDEAILIFREQVKGALQANKENRKDRIADFQEEVAAVYQGLAERCQEGDSPEILRATLKEEIAQIKGSLSQERSEYQATREKLTPLLKEKKEAFRAADEVFKKTMTEAKSDLKDAFKDYQSTAEAEE